MKTNQKPNIFSNRKTFAVLAIFLVFASLVAAVEHEQADENDIFLGRPFHVILTGEQEVPPVDTEGIGDVEVSLDGNELRIEGDFSDLESELIVVGESPAHVHKAPPGEAGPVVFPVVVTKTDDGGKLLLSQTLTDEQMQDLRKGLYYINVHTEEHPEGEIRAQLEGVVLDDEAGEDKPTDEPADAEDETDETDDADEEPADAETDESADESADTEEDKTDDKEDDSPPTDIGTQQRVFYGHGRAITNDKEGYVAQIVWVRNVREVVRPAEDTPAEDEAAAQDTAAQNETVEESEDADQADQPQDVGNETDTDQAAQEQPANESSTQVADQAADGEQIVSQPGTQGDVDFAQNKILERRNRDLFSEGMLQLDFGREAEQLSLKRLASVKGSILFRVDADRDGDEDGQLRLKRVPYSDVTLWDGKLTIESGEFEGTFDVEFWTRSVVFSDVKNVPVMMEERNRNDFHNENFLQRLAQKIEERLQ